MILTHVDKKHERTGRDKNNYSNTSATLSRA